MPSPSELRKRDHLALCATDEVAYKNKTTLFEEVELIHRALPEVGVDDVDCSCELGGRTLAAPLWIGAMTGGAEGTAPFNRELAAVAQELKIGFCFGSLRPMLDDPSRKEDFQVRKDAPDALVMANIGATEIVRRSPAPIIDAVGEIGADGVGIHLNPVMELVQPGGDTDFKGVVDAVAAFVEAAPSGMKVFVKETGCGLSWQDGESLKRAGVAMVETAGSGGTSWIGVEALRAKDEAAVLGRDLWDWGIPTAVTTAWMVDQGFEVVSSGGIRTGLDMAKAVAMGASWTAVAAPLVAARQKGGPKAVADYLANMIHVFRAVLVAVGAKRPEDLRKAPRVMGPNLTRWMETGWQRR